MVVIIEDDHIPLSLLLFKKYLFGWDKVGAEKHITLPSIQDILSDPQEVNIMSAGMVGGRV